MAESATGPLLLCKSKSLPTQKCHAPPAVVGSLRFFDSKFPQLRLYELNIAQLVGSYVTLIAVIPVNTSKSQTVPKQKGAMYTLISGMGVPCTGTLRASVLSDS